MVLLYSLQEGYGQDIKTYRQDIKTYRQQKMHHTYNTTVTFFLFMVIIVPLEDKKGTTTELKPFNFVFVSAQQCSRQKGNYLLTHYTLHVGPNFGP